MYLRKLIAVLPSAFTAILMPVTAYAAGEKTVQADIKTAKAAGRPCGLIFGAGNRS